MGPKDLHSPAHPGPGSEIKPMVEPANKRLEVRVRAGWQAGRKGAYDPDSIPADGEDKAGKEAQNHMHSWATGLSRILGGEGEGQQQGVGKPG